MRGEIWWQLGSAFSKEQWGRRQGKLDGEH